MQDSSFSVLAIASFVTLVLMIRSARNVLSSNDKPTAASTASKATEKNNENTDSSVVAVKPPPGAPPDKKPPTKSDGMKKPATESANKPTKTEALKNDPATEKRRQAVKDALKFAWKGYKDFAWGKDELKPVSKRFNNWLGIGLTIIDTLDTLWIMDLKEEFAEARKWVAEELSFEKNKMVSTFETSIRVFGGLLSAYDLSKDRVFLDKAKDIGDRLLKAFKTATGIPMAQVNLASGRAGAPSWTGGRSILSEVGTLQLEYTYLAKQLNEPMYAQKALNVFDVIDKHNDNGLPGVYIDVKTGSLSGHVTMGALGDSYFEYLLKMWRLTNRQVPRFRKMYDQSANAIADKMIQQTTPNGLYYPAEMQGNGALAHKMDELACFCGGGMFAYGAEGATKARHMEIGAGIAETCHEMWARTKSGIAPEWVQMTGNDFVPGSNGRHYLLRPETIEGFFYMWRLTHDQKYRDWGWAAFQAIEKACKVPSGGYSGIRDVTQASGGTKDDLQQSFFLAETLKYLYLLFSPDDVISLDDYVFNTEAHPISIFKEPLSEWVQHVKDFDPSVAR